MVEPISSFKQNKTSSSNSIDNEEDSNEENEVRPEMPLAEDPIKTKPSPGSTLDNFLKTDEYRNLRRKMNLTLWEYVEQNDLNFVKKMLDPEIYSNFAADPNAKGLNDWTALHMASVYGYKMICLALIQAPNGADVNSRTSIQRTPLHLATLHNHLHIVKLLVENGADINLKDNENNTALHYASMQGYSQIVDWLLQQKPVLETNSLGRTPICLSLNYETYQTFLDYSKFLSVKLPETGYSRVVLGNTLLHNSREDYINKIIAKTLKKNNINDAKAFNERPKFQAKPKTKKLNEKFILPPSKVGPKDFRGITQLGKGSFGEVYLVEKIDNNQQYALKVLRKEKVIGNNLVKYAFTERNILLHISHPFIVKLNYAFQTPEKLVMVMDYCPNGDLGTHLAREKKFTEDKARFYAAQITLALGELHKNAILFRDLKPENVVLDADGNARLTDFGLSKEGTTDEQLSRSFCGSIAYLAPEMLKRSGHTRSVDWYLLGVLSYEMVVGTPPFYSPNRDQMFSNIQKADLKVPQFLSNDCQNFIKELMVREPLKRLGASKDDAEDVKMHPFFSGLNWDDLIKKRLPPPPIKPVRRAPKSISSEKMFGKLKAEVAQRIDGWSVLQSNKK
ncbi:hypothetical protein SteCoe_18108 [Stentor coeruleus]|uniref:Protein kinase domain-containing protein n=1 Tax=Stentor coeruleus TaxID=5963 RepID=A0A1R2BX89_9CILI|nr:hypothetical protein SteCoe_18108 [Stentor coeruleus]